MIVSRRFYTIRDRYDAQQKKSGSISRVLYPRTKNSSVFSFCFNKIVLLFAHSLKFSIG